MGLTVAESYAHNGETVSVGDAVFDAGKPERYGKIVAFGPHPDGKKYPWLAMATVQWKKGLRQPKEVPAHWLRTFDSLLKENERLRDKWAGLKKAALDL